jgi:hypothetical protein
MNMTDRICDTCHKLLNGKYFIVNDKYKNDCNACRRKEYQRQYKVKARAAEKVRAERVEARLSAIDGAIAARKVKESKDVAKRTIATLRHIWQEETQSVRKALATARRRYSGSFKMARNIEDRKVLLAAYDKALEKQIKMIEHGIPVTSIPPLRDMVYGIEKIIPVHLMASLVSMEAE